MKFLVIYDSLYGNTKTIAEAIASVFGQYGETRLVAANAVTDLDLADISLLALGGPTQGHGVSPAIKDFVDTIPPEKLTGVSLVAFDTRMNFARWLSGSAADTIAKTLRRYGIQLLLPPESFLVEGREGPLGAGEAERAANWANTIMGRVASTVAAGV